MWYSKYTALPSRMLCARVAEPYILGRGLAGDGHGAGRASHKPPDAPGYSQPPQAARPERRARWATPDQGMTEVLGSAPDGRG